MISLVTLEEAKSQLRISDTLDDSKIALTILAASAMVLNHIKVDVPVEDSPDTRILQMFDTDTVPEDVKQAVLLVIGDLYENREAANANPISSAVKAILCNRRDPTFA
jgi:hypothetical protein